MLKRPPRWLNLPLIQVLSTILDIAVQSTWLVLAQSYVWWEWLETAVSCTFPYRSSGVFQCDHRSQTIYMYIALQSISTKGSLRSLYLNLLISSAITKQNKIASASGYILFSSQTDKTKENLRKKLYSQHLFQVLLVTQEMLKIQQVAQMWILWQQPQLLLQQQLQQQQDLSFRYSRNNPVCFKIYVINPFKNHLASYLNNS